MIYKADLHLHSEFSNKPSIWALRKFNCPESFTTPDHIYKKALKKGMDYITITDHNTIDGILEIAHHPNTFISSEITTYFPEDNCKIHVVVLNITEENFSEILALRKNIYDLTSYLRQNSIVHFLAHPLYDLNKKLTVETFEKMLILFNIIEVKSGARSKKYSDLLEEVILSLNKEKIEKLVNKHNLEPYGRRPWIKGLVGGSDDHSGLFIARAYTVSRKGQTLNEFIASIESAETWPGGEEGDSLTLAHSIYGIGYSFFRERFNQKKNGGSPFLRMIRKRIFNGNYEKLSYGEKLRLFINKNFSFFSNDFEKANFEKILDIESRNLLTDRHFFESINSESLNKKVFAISSYLANRILYIYTKKLTKMYSTLGLFELINALTSIGFAHLLVTPYYIGYHCQNRNKKLIADISKRMLNVAEDNKPNKIALFTDTLDEINGVAITIKKILETAKKRGIELVVITSTKNETAFEKGVMNFKAIGEFALPEYPELKMCFPPILDVIDYFEREGFNKIHVSTPGSLGLIGLFLARLMEVPISGTYHTDIPQYVRDLTNDLFCENAAWNYMIWFYNLMDEVSVPSLNTSIQLIERGLDKRKIKLLPRWVDTNVFHPTNKDPEIWQRYGFEEEVKFLYVGRVSREKNLELLAKSFRKVIDSGFKAGIVVVGDGPFRKEMEEMLRNYPVLFTGFQAGAELYRLYASSDVFVFPSATDTFGNVVLESQASGIPVIVSDKGGPQELMIHKKTGLVVKAGDTDEFTRAMLTFLEDRDKIRRMGKNARRFTVEGGINTEDAFNSILYGQQKSEISAVQIEELVEA